MTEEKIRELLLAHHRGPDFRQTMVETFPQRFDESFWKLWREQVSSLHGDAPTYLDLGCGPGLMLQAFRQRFPHARLVGVDLQSYMLDAARQVAADVGATIYCQDLHRLALPLPDGSANGIVISMVLHDMLEPVGILREARRLLSDTGRLVIIDWVRTPLSQYLDGSDLDPFAPEANHELRSDRFVHFMEHNKYTIEDLRWILRRVGFQVTHTETRAAAQHVRLVALPDVT
jgi:ubiquinone/menaquinone biosynthesis C-methylase UbiE